MTGYEHTNMTNFTNMDTDQSSCSSSSSYSYSWHEPDSGHAKAAPPTAPERASEGRLVERAR